MTEKQGKTDSIESVYNYLKLQNRPFSANDIMLNLHNEFGKTTVQKALDDLTRDNRIREKIYGKQKIYCALQEDVGEGAAGDSEMEIAQLDARIDELAEKVKAGEAELKATESAVNDLKKEPGLEDCIAEKKELEEDVKNLVQKLESLSKLEIHITDEERNKIYKDSEVHLKEYRKRKRICMDILNTILENCPKPKKALYEEIGIETDEDAGFHIG